MGAPAKQSTEDRAGRSELAAARAASRQAIAVAFAFSALVNLLMLTAPPRLSAAVALLSLGVYLSLLNQAPADPYFSQTLQTWEQGRFIRFHGLAQWLGWAWPYASLLYLLSVIWRQDRQN